MQLMKRRDILSIIGKKNAPTTLASLFFRSRNEMYLHTYIFIGIKIWQILSGCTFLCRVHLSISQFLSPICGLVLIIADVPSANEILVISYTKWLIYSTKQIFEGNGIMRKSMTAFRVKAEQIEENQRRGKTLTSWTQPLAICST